MLNLFWTSKPKGVVFRNFLEIATQIHQSFQSPAAFSRYPRCAAENFLSFPPFLLCYKEVEWCGPGDFVRICGTPQKKKNRRKTTKLLKARYSTRQLAPNSLKLAKRSLALAAKHISSAEDNTVTSVLYLIQSVLFFSDWNHHFTATKAKGLMEGERAVCWLSKRTSRPPPPQFQTELKWICRRNCPAMVPLSRRLHSIRPKRL